MKAEYLVASLADTMADYLVFLSVVGMAVYSVPRMAVSKVCYLVGLSAVVSAAMLVDEWELWWAAM